MEKPERMKHFGFPFINNRSLEGGLSCVNIKGSLTPPSIVIALFSEVQKRKESNQESLYVRESVPVIYENLCRRMQMINEWFNQVSLKEDKTILCTE